MSVSLAEELNRHGIHADILSMYPEDIPGVAEEKESLLQTGIPAVHFLGSRRTSITAVVSAIIRLRRLILEQEYNIVETSLIGPAILAAWATLGTQARLVTGLHQVFRLDQQNSGRHKFLRFSVRCNRRIRYYAISDMVAECWFRYSRTPIGHTRRIYNGIPGIYFSPAPDRRGVRAELGLPMDARLALYVGRLAASKGIDTILNALSPILEKENLFLLYIGLPDLHYNGTEEMLQQMERRIAEHAWGARVRFLGFRIDVPRLMASADVLVHPTRTEGFGLSLIEAMAAGLPVVASDAEAIPEILAGSESAMVPMDDPLALRKAVLEILHWSPTEVDKAVESGRKRAEEFRMEKRIDSMIRLFEDVLAGQF